MIDPKDTRMDELDEVGLAAAIVAWKSPRVHDSVEGNTAAAIRAYLRASTIGGEPVAEVTLPIINQERYYGSEVQAMLDDWNAAHPAPSTGEGDQYEPAAVRLLRGPLSKRATSAEFNEWQAREVIEYIDGLRALSTQRETTK